MLKRIGSERAGRLIDTPDLRWIAMLIACAVALLLGGLAVAQQAPGDPTSRKHGYDVVSIRRSQSSQEMAISATENEYTFRNTSVKKLISIAYDVREDQVTGLPKWASSEDYDISARDTSLPSGTPHEVTWTDRRAYLLSILNERFQLRAHTTKAIKRVYLLQTVEGSNALERSQKNAVAGDSSLVDHSWIDGDIVVSDRFLKGNNVTLSLLAQNLGIVLQRDVIDETGLTGLYNIDLRWIPRDAATPQENSFDSQSLLFDALRSQLGLKLVSGRRDVKAIQVEHIDHPSAN